MTALRKQDGFSLTELLVTMGVFLLVILAASNLFTGILGQFKQQSKVAETNIEGLIGLQMLRADVEQAGFGLPWNLGSATYNEAVNDGATTWDDTLFNDATTNPPRPVILGVGGVIANPPLNSSDVLVIKATSIGTAQAAQRWTYIVNAGANANPAMRWTPDTVNENPATTEFDNRFIVLRPVSSSRQRELILNGTTFFTTFTSTATANTGDPYANPPTLPSVFLPPPDSFATYLYYGVGTSELRMPFNRADFYVKRPTSMPSQCSTDAGTGVLYKATVNHADGGLNELPLLDCVRELRVIFGLDTNNDGASDSWGTALPALAADTRAQLKEIRIYILAHEGQQDATYTSPAAITASDPDAGTVINFNAATANLRNFRWKVYTIAARPHF